MKNYRSFSGLAAAGLFTLITALFFSCASGIGSLKVEEEPVITTPPPAEKSPETPPPEKSAPAEGEYAKVPPETSAPPKAVTEKPSAPPVPEYIMGNGLTEAQSMADFLIASNPGADRDFVFSLAEYYVKEAGAEGINHDVAFSQMCLETGFLNFGGLVKPDMNNFCGLGALSAERPGERFPDPATGVRAHIQHLKAYATDEPLNQELVDPRYFYVRPGSSPTIKGLAGTWAGDRMYAEKINGILVRLYQFSSKEK